MPVYHPDPPRIPADLHGERDVLAALRVLPPDVHVFTRLKLFDESANRDREIDFLILHPALGILLVEAKGGRIEFDGTTWHRIFQNQRQAMRESPAEQLEAQQYLLLRTLQARCPGFTPQVTRLLALPHMDLEGRDLGPDLPAIRILDRPALGRLQPALREAVHGGLSPEQFVASERARYCRIPDDRMLALIQALEPALLPPPSLPELLAEETRLQDAGAERLLDHLAENFSKGRFRVQGSPGSGKSLLARKTARLWASEGRKVLFVAYNRALVYATQVAMDEAGLSSLVSVATFHDFARTQLDTLGIAAEPTGGMQSYFDHELPAHYAKIANQVAERWEALVVDEAQDLEAGWVDTLVRMLRDPEHDPVLLLEDPSQDLYRSVQHTHGTLWRIDLNLRQHPVLRRAVWEALPNCGWGPPEPAQEPGVLTLRKSHADTWKQDLASVLQNLCDSGLKPSQILVLSPHHPERSLGLRDGQTLGPWRLNLQRDWWEGDVADHVRLGTVHAFKGLEADVVVYLAPSGSRTDAPRLRYAALSRARHRAVVLEKAIAKPESTVPAPPSAPRHEPAPRFDARTAMAGQKEALVEALSAARRKPTRSG